MQGRRPSTSIVAGLILVIAAIFAVLFQIGTTTDSPESGDDRNRAGRRAETMAGASSGSTKSARPDRASRIEKVIGERFSEEDEAAFYAYQDGMSLSYSQRGLMDFYEHIRKALRGDGDSLTEILTTYRVGEDEGYGVFINILMENVGDDFFFEQIRKQPEDIQSHILGLIWERIWRFPLDYKSDGSIPLADNGLYYPKCGGLFLEVLEKKLQSEHWQRRKKLKEKEVDGWDSHPCQN